MRGQLPPCGHLDRVRTMLHDRLLVTGNNGLGHSRLGSSTIFLDSNVMRKLEALFSGDDRENTGYLVPWQGHHGPGERAEEISDFVDFAIFLLVPSAMRAHDVATLHRLFFDGCSTQLILLRMVLQLLQAVARSIRGRSFISERHHWIDTRRFQRWQEARSQGCQGQEQGHDEECCRIVGFHVVEHSCHQTR